MQPFEAATAGALELEKLIEYSVVLYIILYFLDCLYFLPKSVNVTSIAWLIPHLARFSLRFLPFHR